jgi:hypothetical protein
MEVKFMKKIILVMIFVFGVLGFSEKLHTDGKFHEKELIGEYKGMLEIKLKNGELYLYNNWDTPKLLAKLVKLKNGVFRVDYYNKRAYPQKAYYTAWDIKYKTMVDVDDKLNIIYNNYQKFK